VLSPKLTEASSQRDFLASLRGGSPSSLLECNSVRTFPDSASPPQARTPSCESPFLLGGVGRPCMLRVRPDPVLQRGQLFAKVAGDLVHGPLPSPSPPSCAALTLPFLTSPLLSSPLLSSPLLSSPLLSSPLLSSPLLSSPLLSSPLLSLSSPLLSSPLLSSPLLSSPLLSSPLLSSPLLCSALPSPSRSRRSNPIFSPVYLRHLRALRVLFCFRLSTSARCPMPSAAVFIRPLCRSANVPHFPSPPASHTPPSPPSSTAQDPRS
jgi:hypothetical protein